LHQRFAGLVELTVFQEDAIRFRKLRQPARTLPLALGIGTVLVTALYLALNFVFIYASPLEELKT